MQTTRARGRSISPERRAAANWGSRLSSQGEFEQEPSPPAESRHEGGADLVGGELPVVVGNQSARFARGVAHPGHRGQQLGLVKGHHPGLGTHHHHQIETGETIEVDPRQHPGQLGPRGHLVETVREERGWRWWPQLGDGFPSKHDNSIVDGGEVLTAYHNAATNYEHMFDPWPARGLGSLFDPPLEKAHYLGDPIHP